MIFLSLVILAGVIQIPYFQTKLVNHFSGRLERLTGYEVSISHINIDWFDQIAIQGLTIIDPQGNTMLNAQSVQVNYQLMTFFEEADKGLDDIYLNHAYIYLEKIAVNDSAYALNIDEFIRKLRGKKQKNKPSASFTIDHVKLSNTKFKYNDPFRDSVKTGFDYSHFTVYDINGDFGNLFIVADTLALDVRSLQGKDSVSSLRIDKMETSFFLCAKAMKFNELDLIIGKSRIKDSVVFQYNKLADVKSFNSRVRINAHFDKTLLHSNELTEFIPSFKGLDEYYDITGNFSGRVNSFLISDMDLKFGSGSMVRGKVRMVGLPNIDETSIDFDLSDSYVTINDLKKYIKPKTYNRLAPLENVGFNAEFVGFVNDFVANGDFYTKYGRINSDINLKLDEDISKSYYKGALEMIDFDIGGYTDNEIFQKVTLNGAIQGTGFTLEQADFELKGRIDSIGLNNYNYEDITTDARFTKEFFQGFLSINDTNLKMDMNGSIDIRGGADFFNLNVQLDTALLRPLNLTTEDIFIQSDLDVKARGLKVDEILGSANFINTTIRRKQEVLHIDSLSIISDKDETLRNIFINTSLFAAKIDGEFEFTTVYKELGRLIYEYKLNLENDEQKLRNYYTNKELDYKDYSMNYSLNIKDIDPIASVFVPDLHLSPFTKIEGNITGGYTSILNIQSNIDTLIYKGDTFINDEIQLNISKIADSTNVLALTYVTSEFQEISRVNTKDLFFEGIWSNNHIDFEFDLTQIKYPNYAQLTGAINFLPNHTEINFDPSDLQILTDKWAFEENNLITIQGRDISFSNMSVYHEQQRVSINGSLSEDPRETLTFQIDSLEIDNVNSILNKQLAGRINGYTTISDAYNNLQVNSELSISQFAIDNFIVGDIYGKNIWDNQQKRFDVSVFIDRFEKRVFDIEGFYTPNLDNGLDLSVTLNDTELKFLEPFFSSYFTDIKGTARGSLQVNGTPGKPQIAGKGTIRNGGMHVNYLNTDYSFYGGFYMDKNKIGFKNVSVADEASNLGNIDGFLSHQNFKEFFINLNGSIREFMVLNTTSKDNSLFYGTGIATGNIKFYGPVSNMSITADAQTDKGTKIFIPIGNSGNIEKEEFINFVDLKDSTTFTDLLKSKTNLRGLNLDFDLKITRDAYCEIIFDIKAGDIIRGRGNGDLKLQIDTKGEFNMFGDYVIEEGGYNFTLYNIINKEFEMLPNSKISWYGDPYEGILDINASYNQVASFLPVLESNTGLDYSGSTELRRNYPVKVLLDIEGRLLSPEVVFDIVTEELPRNLQVQITSEDEVTSTESVDLEFQFLAFKNSIDEQELKRQVFSLIILRRFSPLQSFNTGGSISRSVSELLSNQLSYWVTQVDENLEIDLDLGAMDNDEFNTFQLRLSYTLLDGRLRITRDGGFTNQQNKADVNSIAGDWTLEYLLTDDGKFKVKMYNRTNYNPINPTEDTQNTITTGFSLIHTQSFDELKELFQKSRKKAKKSAYPTPETSANNEDSVQKELN